MCFYVTNANLLHPRNVTSICIRSRRSTVLETLFVTFVVRCSLHWGIWKLIKKSYIKCTECDYEARDSKSEHKHFRFNHGEKRIKCELCDFSLRTEKGLMKHKSLKHSDKLAKFKCNMCDFSSVWSLDLKRHIETKHQNSQSMCTICSYVGPNQRSFKHHMKKHEGKAFNCGNCDYSSSTQAQLYANIRDCGKSDQLV